MQWSSKGQSVGSTNCSGDAAYTQAGAPVFWEPVPAVVQKGFSGAVKGPNQGQSVGSASCSCNVAYTQTVATVFGKPILAVVQHRGKMIHQK